MLNERVTTLLLPSPSFPFYIRNTSFSRANEYTRRRRKRQIKLALARHSIQTSVPFSFSFFFNYTTAPTFYGTSDTFCALILFILQTSKKFTSELNNTGVAHSKFAGQTYDAVWAMALALAETEVLLNRQNESMAQYTHTRKDLAQLLLEQLKNLRFIGVSVSRRINKAQRARPFITFECSRSLEEKCHGKVPKIASRKSVHIECTFRPQILFY